MNVGTRMMVRGLTVVLVGLTAAACSNQPNSANTDMPSSNSASSRSSGSSAAKTFGDLPSPCGPGSARIAGGENGGSTLKLGTATDHGADAAPGTNEEMLDAAVAFAKWCNAQGGIAGLKVEVVDLDGKLFQVPAAIEQACSSVFAMVGGEWVFDEQQFPRFTQCKMVSFPTALLSAEAMGNADTVQAVPSIKTEAPYGWFEWAAKSHPQDVKKTAVLYADNPAIIVARNTILQQLSYTGIASVTQMSYSINGEANWAPFAQKLKDSGIETLTFVGSPGNYALLAKAMTEIGYKPNLVLNDSNFYTDLLVQPGNVKNVEGMSARTVFVPFEEAGRNKALQDYEDMMSTYNPKGLKAQQGMAATSALLLFGTAAKSCIASNGGVLERKCVLAAGKKVTSWTGGGLHAVTGPATGAPTKCITILQIKDGKWTREYPQLGSSDDSGKGYHCYDPGLMTVTGK